MRVSSSLLLAFSASASLASAGPCGYGLTCVEEGRTYAPCSPEAAAEFELVAPLLQQCDDATRYFNRGVWDSRDKPQLCALTSPCARLVPYILNTDVYSRLCAPYQKFTYVVYTFLGYCRGEPVAELPGDNGLLASLKQQSQATTAPPKPTTTAPPPPTTAQPTTPPPTTTAPPAPEPTATKSEANDTTAPSPTANGSGSSSSSGPGESENETTEVGPDAAAGKTPAPVPSSTKPATSSAGGLLVSMTTTATCVALSWLK